MHSWKSISVVIPTFNRKKTLKTVFPSYLNQKGVQEIIIVDDGSTDGTESFVKENQEKYKGIIYIKNKKNLGLPASRNIGVLNASGEFIVFGEDDLRFGSNYAWELMQCLIKNRSSIAAGRIIYPLPEESDMDAIIRLNVPSKSRFDKRRITFDASSPAEYEMQVPFIHAISMARADVFKSIRYDPGFKGNAFREETDFYLRAGKEGHKIFFCPRAICIHLPREVHSLGGTMNKGLWTYKYWSLRNNFRFLRRHYRFLETNGLAEGSFVTLMFYFAFSELKKIPSFYLRKYAPKIYVRLYRYVSR